MQGHKKKMTKTHSTTQLVKGNDNMRLNNTIKSIAVTSVWMWEFIKYHKVKPSTRAESITKKRIERIYLCPTHWHLSVDATPCFDSPLRTPRHIHEHKCASWQCDVNVANIKKQKNGNCREIETSWNDASYKDSSCKRHTNKNELP